MLNSGILSCSDEPSDKLNSFLTIQTSKPSSYQGMLGFTTATILQDLLENDRIVGIPSSLGQEIGGVLDHLDNGLVYLFETDEIKAIHKALHELMFEAVLDGWQILFVDVANCFNPHRFGEIASDAGENGYHLLKRIHLARPFQVHQSVAVVEQLAKRIEQLQRKKPGKRLVIITGITSQFFDLQQATEDEEFPIPQLEKLRYTLGIIKSLATQGHTVLMTDSTKDFGISKILNKAQNKDQFPRIQASALAYIANVHIRIKHEQNERFIGKSVILKKHPYRPPEIATEKIPLQVIKRKEMDVKQKRLSDWF